MTDVKYVFTGAAMDAERRAAYTLKAQIEQMDNGASMIIRRQATGQSFGEIVLKRVYVDPASLLKDLIDNMEFNFKPDVIGGK
jgi:hypothetical protein